MKRWNSWIILSGCSFFGRYILVLQGDVNNSCMKGIITQVSQTEFQITYILVRIEDSIAVSFEDRLDVITRVGLILDELCLVLVV